MGASVGACAAGLLLSATGCVTVTSAADESTELGGAPGYEAVAPEAPAAGPQPFIGLELEEVLSGSLEAMTFLGGLRAAAVAAGSPAEAAGLRVGDRVVRASGVELARLDQWAALLAQKRPGDRIALSVERDGGLADVEVAVALRGGAALPPPRRFVERRRARCVVETVAVEVDGRPVTAARIVECGPTSPLKDARIVPGDLLVALDGVELSGAADFARRVSTRPPGSDVVLDVRSGAERRKVKVELAAPERHVTALRLWPLFGWAEPVDESHSDLVFLDLWLLWLFKYERDGATCRYDILRLIHWETGQGALIEEPAEPGS